MKQSRKENKRINRIEDNLTSGIMLNAPTFESKVSQKKKDKRKGHKKILEIIDEKFPEMGKEIIIQAQES